MMTLMMIVLCVLMMLFMITHKTGVQYVNYDPPTNSAVTLFKEQPVTPVSNNYTPKEWSYIYYQHARKCGGTSLETLFKSNSLCSSNTSVIPKLICKGLNPHKFIKATFIEIKQYFKTIDLKLIHNEWMPFYLMDYLKFGDSHWSDVLMTTLLRNPIDRVFSDLLHTGTWGCQSKELNDPYLIERFLSDNRTDLLESFLIDCVMKYQYKYTSNMFTKIFSGSWNSQISDKALENWNIPFNANHTVNKLHFEFAKYILNEFDVILILELWNQTNIQLKCHKIYDISLKHQRVGKRRNFMRKSWHFEVDELEELHALILKLNQYDLELYDFAKDLALEKTKRCKEYLEN
eukprot:544594_1